MGVSPATFLVVTAMMGSVLGTACGEAIAVGVMVDVGVDQKSLSKTVKQMTAENGPKVVLKWIYLNSTGKAEVIAAVCGAIVSGVRVLVTVLGCPQSQMVTAIAGTVHIPHLSVDVQPCLSHTNGDFSLHLRTNTHNVINVLLDVARLAEWKQVALETGSTVDPLTMQYFLVELSSIGVQTVLKTSDDYSMVFEHGNVVLMVDPHTRAHRTMQQIHIYDATRIVLMNDLTEDVEKLLSGLNNKNVLLIKTNETSSFTLGGLACSWMVRNFTFVERRLAKALILLVKAVNRAHNNSISEANHSVWPENNNRRVSLESRIMGQLQQICRTDESMQCNDQEMGYNLFGIRAGQDRRHIPVGEWTENRRLTIYNRIAKGSFLRKDPGFNGVTLRVVVDGDSHPYVSRHSPGTNSFYGMTIDILEDLAEHLHFKYTFVEADDGLYGSKTENGTWSGMVGMVSRKEADLGVATFTITTERSEVVDFTTAILQDSLGILTPKPRQTTSRFQVFKPFNVTIWLSVLLSGVVACLTFAFINLKSYAGKQRLANKQITLLQESVNENVFLILSSYFEQGPTTHPKSVSARCFLAFWFVFTVLIMAMYTAHLAAVLTVSAPVRPINTLQDLADQTDMGLVLMKGTSTWDLFLKSQRPVYKTIVERLEPRNSEDELFQSVKEGKYSTVGDRGYLQYLAELSCGKMRIADEQFYGFSLAFIVPKRSPYKAAINMHLQKMVESGMIDALKRKWMTFVVQCPTSDSAGPAQKLGLETLGGIFIVYGGIAVGAVLVLLLEISTNRCKQCCVS